MNTKFLPDIHKDESQRWNLDYLMLPSLSTTNSLVLTMNITLTNIFPRSSVAVAASSTFAIFTALNLTHKMTVDTA